MEYTTLKKLYYTNTNDHEAEYLRRYNAPFTQHFDISIKEEMNLG